METITIDKKKYVVVEQKTFEQLQTLAASKIPVQRKLSLKEAKKHSYKLIDTWAAKEK